MVNDTIYSLDLQGLIANDSNNKNDAAEAQELRVLVDRLSTSVQVLEAEQARREQLQAALEEVRVRVREEKD